MRGWSQGTPVKRVKSLGRKKLMRGVSPVPVLTSRTERTNTRGEKSPVTELVLQNAVSKNLARRNTALAEE
jgi:hypothetical protein